MAGARRLHFRERALADVEAAAQWYAEHAGAEVASGFLAALADAYAQIARHPGTGSPRWGQTLHLPALSSSGLKRFPWLVFYVQSDDEIEVWRVLHTSRDIPATLAEPPDTP